MGGFITIRSEKFSLTHYLCRVYNNCMRNIVILLASGSGSRVGGEIPKQFIKLNSKYLFEYSLETFDKHVSIDEVLVVCHKDYIEFVRQVVRENCYKKVKRVLPGGDTRQESVYNGIFSVSAETANILIHDSARPFVTNEMINRVLGALEHNSAVSTVVPATDTMFTLDNDGNVKTIPDRKELYRVQTPQGFYLNTIRKAHHMAQKEGLNLATDDCSLVLHYKLTDIATVCGDEIAFKVTTPADLMFAKGVLDNRAGFNAD